MASAELSRGVEKVAYPPFSCDIALSRSPAASRASAFLIQTDASGAAAMNLE